MVVIIGGGITGAATAYYLSRQQQQQQKNPPTITILDIVGPAACSKAAAFLSESWGDGTKTEKLHRLSFQLHQQLAQELCLKSYREIPAYQGELEKWNGNLMETFQVKPGRHALVDPQELVNALIDQSGATVETGSVSGFPSDGVGGASGIFLEDGKVKPVTQEEPIVVAMGPWTSRLEDWLDHPIPMPIDGVLSTSLVWHESSLFDSPLAVFCEEDIRGCHLEIFQRVDNSLYVSGLGNSKLMKAAQFRSPNRPIPGEEQTARPNAALTSLGQSSLVHDDSPPDRICACIRPMSPDGIPVVGKVAGNIYVATGGGQWGVTWGPLIGQTVASQICGQPGPLASNLRPKRFDTTVQRSLLERRNKDVANGSI